MPIPLRGLLAICLLMLAPARIAAGEAPTPCVEVRPTHGGDSRWLACDWGDRDWEIAGRNDGRSWLNGAAATLRLTEGRLTVIEIQDDAEEDRP